MADFVLVHGAWGGGASYASLAARLRTAGHNVHIATLTGLGEKAHLLSPAITLSTHIADVRGLIAGAGLTDFILAGHSYGGMIITALAAEMQENIRHLVYIDAFLPAGGEALWDIATDWERAHYIDAQRDHPGLVSPFPGAPPHLTLHPLLTLIEPVKTGADERLAGKRSYVYATRGAPKTFGKFHARASAEPGWRVHALESGHDVMADAPDELYQIMLEIAS